MPRIAIEPPELRQRANQIDSSAAAIEQEINGVEQSIELLRPYFKGVTAERFFATFEDRRAFMKTWDDIVRRYADRLRVIANEIEARDNQGR